MAINPPNFGQISSQAGQITLNLRTAMQQVVFFNEYIQNLGQAGLVTLGFSSGDATLLLSVYTNLAAIASAYLGGSYTGPALPFNFQAQTIPLWGGQ